MTEREKIISLVNAFKPDQELKPGDSRYVDCAVERGTDHLLDQMERHIRYSLEPTSQIFGGHRGGGKTTELFRLKQRLETGDEKYLISYCEANNYIEMVDIELADVLMALIQQLWIDAETLDIHPAPNRIKSVLSEAWQTLNQATVALDQLTVTAALVQFRFLVKNSPDNRALVRQHLRPRTPQLVEAVNEIVAKIVEQAAKRGYQGLVVIVDNLDRMIGSLDPGPSGRPRHVELFIDSADTLKSVACHTIYVVPMSLLHSTALANIAPLYGAGARKLPMTPVSTYSGDPFEPGIEKLVEMIEQRVRYAGVKSVFDTPETVRRLAGASGGYVRQLMTLATSAITLSGQPPVTRAQVEEAIRQARDEYVAASQLPKIRSALREVAKSHQIDNTPEHLELLERFLVLEYYDREKGYWYDLNPVLKETYSHNS